MGLDYGKVTCNCFLFSLSVFMSMMCECVCMCVFGRREKREIKTEENERKKIKSTYQLAEKKLIKVSRLCLSRYTLVFNELWHVKASCIHIIYSLKFELNSMKIRTSKMKLEL